MQAPQLLRPADRDYIREQFGPWCPITSHESVASESRRRRFVPSSTIRRGSLAVLSCTESSRSQAHETSPEKRSSSSQLRSSSENIGRETGLIIIARRVRRLCESLCHIAPFGSSICSYRFAPMPEALFFPPKSRDRTTAFSLCSFGEFMQSNRRVRRPRDPGGCSLLGRGSALAAPYQGCGFAR